MKLVLVRHGKTEYNKIGLIHGHNDGKLSEEGRESNRKTAETLRHFEFDIIYSSDLGRAVETAEEIAKSHPNTPVVKTPLLRERHYGIYQGKPRPKSWEGKKKHEREAPGGETWQEVEARIREFVYMLKQERMRDTVLIVGHNGSLGILIPVLLGEEDYTTRLNNGFTNSKPIYIELTETSARLIDD